MEGETDRERLDAEWVTVNALRELMRMATQGDSSQSTYNHALELGARICPQVLGEDVSLLRRHRESATVREFRQKAEAKSRIGDPVSALTLLETEITEYRDLLATARNRQRTDQLKSRLTQMEQALEAIAPNRHSEGQLIWRDAFSIERDAPALKMGQGHKDFLLPDNNVLRVRVTHPERAESISGADIIYERHSPEKQTANIVGVQYKIWEDRTLYLTDHRMQRQLNRMQEFFCKKGLCEPSGTDQTYRFPFCSAFLRPTDRLQTSNQELRSTGEHLPICLLNKVKSVGARGAEILRYDDVREASLSYGVFEELFTSGKIGSRTLRYEELQQLYGVFDEMISKDHILIHAQDFDDSDSRAS